VRSITVRAIQMRWFQRDLCPHIHAGRAGEPLGGDDRIQGIQAKFYFLIDPVSVSLRLIDGCPRAVTPVWEELMNRRSSLFAAALLLLACVLSTVPGATQPAQPPIKIGFGMALTGGLAAGGKQALVTYQLWAEEVNARGGLLGRKVELVYYDDQSNPATVPAIYSKLLDVDKVDLVLSGYGTVPTAAAMPTVMQRK